MNTEKMNYQWLEINNQDRELIKSSINSLLRDIIDS